jgi:hypothetical protein
MALQISSSFYSRLSNTHREIPKKPAQVLFTRSGQTIVVADKFGDVFRWVALAPNSLLSTSLLMSPELPALAALYTYASAPAEYGS